MAERQRVLQREPMAFTTKVRASACAVLRCAGMEACATACAAHSCPPSMCRRAADCTTTLREARRLSAPEQQAHTNTHTHPCAARCTVFLSVCLLHGLSAAAVTC